MLGNKLEQDILEVFDSDYSQLFSINQISKKLKKSYPHINAKVNNLISEGVLSKANVGRSYLCSLNLDNEKSVALLILEGSIRKDRAISKIRNMPLFLEEISRIKADFKTHTIILNKNSLIFVIDYLNDKEAIKNRFSIIKQFSLIFFDKEGFKEHLLQSPSSKPGQVVLYSYEKYFEFVSAVKGELISKKLFGKTKGRSKNG